MIVRVRARPALGIVADYRPVLKLVRAQSTYVRQTIHLQRRFGESLCRTPARRWVRVTEMSISAATCQRCLGLVS